MREFTSFDSIQQIRSEKKINFLTSSSSEVISSAPPTYSHWLFAIHVCNWVGHEYITTLIACCCLKSRSMVSLTRPDGKLWIKLSKGKEKRTKKKKSQCSESASRAFRNPKHEPVAALSKWFLKDQSKWNIKQKWKTNIIHVCCLPRAMSRTSHQELLPGSQK